jgi:ElaB/YqjD/DUF883 family membrane-anchored ribosome-binding protein
VLSVLVAAAGTLAAAIRFMDPTQTLNSNDDEDDFEREVMIIAERTRRAVEEFVREKPHAALAVAAATGFVLGGGLTPRRIFRLGFALGTPVLSRQVIGLLSQYVTSAVESQGQKAGATAPRPAVD